MWPTGGSGPPRRALLALCVAVPLGLWFAEVQPRLEDHVYTGADGLPLHLPEWLRGDCPFYRATAQSLLAHRSLDLRGSPLWSVLRPESQVAVARDGRWVPKHPLLLPVVALPFYAALGDDGLLVFNLLQVVGLDALLLLLARRATSEPIALAIALWFAFGSLLRPAAFNFSPDVLSTLVALGGVLLLLSARSGWAGALLGLSVWAKWTNLFLLPPAALYALLALSPRAALRFTLAALPPLALLGALDFHLFGSPLVTPYDRVLAFGGGLEPSHRARFDQPFWSTLWRQLADPRLGLLRSAPQALLAVPGWWFLFRRARAEALLVASLCAVQLATFASYRDWQASDFGHRFLLTVVALSALPLAALAQAALAPRE